MEVAFYYALFAFSISITACIFWFTPLIQEAKGQNIQNSFTQYPKLSTCIYILVSAVVAPLIVPTMFSQGMADRFSKGLRSEILKPDSKN